MRKPENAADRIRRDAYHLSKSVTSYIYTPEVTDEEIDVAVSNAKRVIYLLEKFKSDRVKENAPWSSPN